LGAPSLKNIDHTRVHHFKQKMKNIFSPENPATMFSGPRFGSPNIEKAGNFAASIARPKA